MYYLNNSGSRWKVPGDKFASLELDPKTGNSRYHVVIRTPEFYEQVGQFACVVYKVRGKRQRAFFDDFRTFAYGMGRIPVVLPPHDTVRQYLSGQQADYADASFSEQWKFDDAWLGSFGIAIAEEKVKP
jgi:hypothetical protein